MRHGERWVDEEAFHLAKTNNSYQNARFRAKSAGVPFELTLEYVREIFPKDGKCPVFGIPMVWGDNSGRQSCPSLDRVDPTKGYTPGNVCFISQGANRLKNNATLEEMESIVAYMKYHAAKTTAH